MTRLLLAFDKFKGSLRSSDVAHAFSEGWCEVMPDSEVDIVEISDGGDGLVETLVGACGGEYVAVDVADPLGRPVAARYGTIHNGTTAIIEMAEAAGLRLLAAEERNPLNTSTRGVGELIADALGRGCRELIIGLGGSATNDGGMGMLEALGAKFYDTMGELVIPSGEALERVAAVDLAQLDNRLCDTHITIASDVDNPLYGERGAAWVYAPQKGADRATVERLDAGLRSYAGVVASVVGVDMAGCAGAGAAGGVGFALMALLGAEMQRGIDLMLRMVDFEQRVGRCDIVVTGEGRLDRQTLMGKAPEGVLNVARRVGRDVIAVGGSVAWCDELRTSGFKRIYEAMPEGMTLEEAMRPDVARANLRRVAERAARELLAEALI